MHFKKHFRKYIIFATFVFSIPVLAKTTPLSATAFVQASQGDINESEEPGPDNGPEDTPEKPTEKQLPILTGTNSYSIKYKYNASFSLGIQSTGNGTLLYTSSNPSVASVTPSGFVFLRGTGICQITVFSQENENYLPASYTITVNVWKSPVNTGYSTSYKRSKFYHRLMNLKLYGNHRNNLLAIAKSQLGYHESSSRNALQGSSKGGGNYTEYGRFYGMNGVPWCAIFVNWVAREAGISYKVVPKECAVRMYYSFYQKKHLAYSWTAVRKKKRIPKKGDIIFYSYSYKATTHHIGYVDSCTYKGSKVILKVVEGNQKNRVNSLIMTLRRSNVKGRIPARSMYITGFASPKY